MDASARRAATTTKGRTAEKLRFLLMAAVTALLSLGYVACGGDGDTTGPEEDTTDTPPSITSVDPSEGTVGTEVKIIGSNFRSGLSVFFNDLAADSVDRTADTLAFAIAPSPMSSGETFDLAVQNSDGTADTASGAFTAVTPTLDFVNGASKPSGQEGSTVVLDGDSFGDLQGPGRVLFSDGAGGTVEATIAAEDDWTNTFILTTVPSGAGDGDLVVETSTGTSNAITFNVTSSASFSPSNVDWVKTGDLPTGLSGHSATFVRIDAGSSIDRYVHVTGGTSNDSVPTTGVLFAPILSDGSIDPFTSTSDLSAARAFHAVVSATPFNSRVSGDGYLYALGGIETKGGDPVNTVLRAPLNGDGTVGTWSQLTTLPEALHSLDALVFRSNLYVSGGATTANEPVDKVYRAVIDSLGELGSWNTLQSLPNPRAHHQMTVLGNCLHVFDGDSAAFDPELGDLTDTRYIDIAGSVIDLRSSDLKDGWSIDDTQPSKARNRHTAVITAGVVLRTAGWYDGVGSGSSENMYAPILSGCDVDDFNGANNSQSIFDKGGGNLFSHAAVSYVDGSGTTHVMILGGDDVDSPGNKRSAVWFY